MYWLPYLHMDMVLEGRKGVELDGRNGGGGVEVGGRGVGLLMEQNA